MSSAQYSNPALSVAVKKQYLDESTADIFFVFETDDGQCERVPCHKFVLASNSEVFRAMLSGSGQEKGDIKIIDASAAAFKEFLRFFYFDEVELFTETAEEVFCLGQNYLVKTCVDACVQHLSDNLTLDNVCSVYALSTFYGQEELIKWCEVVIGLNAAAIFKSCGFLECDQQIVSQILKLDTLSCPEIDVFEGCVAWMRAASNQEIINKELVEMYLGESFQDIRFGIMTEEQVNGIFASHENLFSATERKEIVRVAKSKRVKSETVSKEPRKSACDDNYRLKCVRKIQKEQNLYYLGEESTTFSANAPLLLRALVFGEIVAVRGYYANEQTTIDEDLNAKLKIIEFRHAADGNTSYFRTVYTDDKVCLNASRNRCNVAELSKPLIIKPGYTYRISYNLLGPSNGRRFGTTFGMGHLTEVQMQSGITVTFSNDVTQSNRIRGLLCGLHFNPI